MINHKFSLLGLLVLSIFLVGCSVQSFIDPKATDEQKGNKIIFEDTTFTYHPLSIRDWKARTDKFTLTDRNSLLMEGNAWVDATFHETHFVIDTDLDLCRYKSVALNSTLTSLAHRESASPSSQVWIQGIKYSSHSADNITKEKYSHNLKFFSDGATLTWIDDEMESHGITCNQYRNLTIIIRDTADINGTAFSSMEIFNIKLGEEI